MHDNRLITVDTVLMPSTQAMATQESVCTIETVTDLAGFEKLRPAWNRLLEHSDANCIFLTWEWLHTWWKHLRGKRELHILTVRCGSELTGIAPLAIRPAQYWRLLPFRALEFLGTGTVGSDYLDIIVRRGYEVQVQCALLEHLSNCRLVLEFSQIKSGISRAQALSEELAKRGWRTTLVIGSVCPYAELAQLKWEDYVANLGSAHRRNLKRRIRDLYRDFHVALDMATDEQQRAEYFKKFLNLHNQCWAERGGSEAFMSTAIVEFHDEFSRLALERGWLRLRLMALDGVQAAAVYGFSYGEVFYYYQAGFNPAFSNHSVGLCSLGLSIKGALEEGLREYDLLHGGEAYKSLWARNSRRLYRIDMYPPNRSGARSFRSMLARERVKYLRNSFLRPTLQAIRSFYGVKHQEDHA